MKKTIRKGVIVKYVSDKQDFINAYGIYFEVWRKEGNFVHIVSLKNSIGECAIPCSRCEIVNM